MAREDDILCFKASFFQRDLFLDPRLYPIVPKLSSPSTYIQKKQKKRCGQGVVVTVYLIYTAFMPCMNMLK